MRRAVEVEGVAQRGKLPLEPAFVQDEAVRVGDGNRVERDVEGGAEPGVLAEEPGEEAEGEGADGLVRMRDADRKRRRAPAADRQQLDRPPLRGAADGFQPGDPRELRDQGAGLGAKLLPGEELAEVRRPSEEPEDVARLRYESSFEE